ncbi:hypothetical protein EV213_10762 [Aureibacillus halotolerans]|uniref:Uncharacterized protein n=1 Tax=Aureibacillus halotolerans TaxID=1508390 RepID=A0A4R6U5E5_9BACI|nr:hypothetical protein EV213_10762 [Aureibacillus halotolerans]
MKRRAEHPQTGKWFFHFSRLEISVPQFQRAAAGQRKAERRCTEAQVRTSSGREMVLHISLARGFLRRSFYGAQLAKKSGAPCASIRIIPKPRNGSPISRFGDVFCIKEPCHIPCSLDNASPQPYLHLILNHFRTFEWSSATQESQALMTLYSKVEPERRPF